MISHEKKFAFIHINKTGGTSIAQVLRRFAPNDVFNKHEMIYEIPKNAQQSFLNQENVLNQLKDGVDYFKFTFVRNPWDRCVSNFFHNKKRHPEKRHAKMNFKDYLDDLDSDWTTSYNQIDWLLDGSGKNQVDFIGRFENLEEDFSKVCSTLGIKNYELPHVFKSAHGHYRTYYDKEDAIKIEKFYKRDVEYFNYKF
jgi:hypothetical protein